MSPLRERARSGLVGLARRVARRWYWELRAKDIDARWGHDGSDHALVGSVLDRVRPERLLDIGCGTGRLLPVFLQRGVHEVVGQDISRWALGEARRRFPQPNVSFMNCEIEQLRYPAQYFDLCISNRVLSAVPPHRITATLRALLAVCKHIYLNEYSSSDGGEPSDYWFLHDYLSLFAALAEYTIVEQGQLGLATYHVLRIDSPKRRREAVP